MTVPNAAIDAYLEGQLTDELARDIDRWIAADPANAKAFLHLVRTHQMLGIVGKENKLAHEASAIQPESIDPVTLASLAQMEALAEPVAFDEIDQPFAFEPGPAQPSPTNTDLTQALRDLRWAAGKFTSRLVRSPLGISAAFAALLLIGLLLLAPWQSPEPPNSTPLANTPNQPAPTRPAQSPIVATLTATHDATWAEGALAPGSQLHSGDRLTLNAGFAEITTHSGAVAILEAPTTVELLDNNNALHLHAGKLVGLCHTPSSKGFVVKTDHADITDIGTEFGVQVANNTLTTTVFKGDVEVSTPGGTPRRLTTNQTARLSVNGSNRELAVEEQLALGFDALRSRPTQNTLKLPMTGVGIAVGEVDTNWQIVAINGQSLNQPLALHRVDEYKRDSLQVPDSPARWVAREISKDPSADLQGSVLYTLRANLIIPKTIDLANAQLTLRYLVDDAISEIRLNGQSLPINKPVRLKRLEIATQPIVGPLVLGQNTIEFEIANIRSDSFQNYVGLIADWQLTEQPTEPPSP